MKESGISPKNEMEIESKNTGGSMTEYGVLTSSEVKTPKKNRRFTAQYKMEILREWELSKGNSGAVGELLRREGLYSSALVEWKRQRDSGALNALSKKRGRKLKKTAEAVEIERLKKYASQWEKKYRQAMVVIEVQKKISEILGVKQVDTSHIEELED